MYESVMMHHVALFKTLIDSETTATSQFHNVLILNIPQQRETCIMSTKRIVRSGIEWNIHTD